MQKEINNKIKFLDSFYDESERIDSELDIYDKYISLKDKIKKDWLLNCIYCNALEADSEIETIIKSMREKLEKFNLYLGYSYDSKNNDEMQSMDIFNKIEFLYLPSLCFYLHSALCSELFEHYYEENLSYFSIVDLYYSIFFSIFSKLPSRHYEDVEPFEKSVRKKDYLESAKYLGWNCWFLFQELKEKNDGKIDAYIFENMNKDIFKESSLLMPKSKKYNNAYLKGVLLRTIKILIAGLQCYNELEEGEKNIIEAIRNNPGLGVEDLDFKLNTGSGLLQSKLPDICEKLKIFYIEKDGRKSHGFKALKKYLICINQILQDCDT